MPDAPHDSSELGSPYRVAVCGSNYGQAYLDALAESPGRFSVVALLARGSERSRRLAARHGIPLRHTAGELPAGVDLACAALPASADGVVLELLERGIHVLCEHPRGPDFIDRATATAEEAGVCFQVNGHFSDLPAPRAFADRCRERLAAGPLRFVELVAHERSLYAALDIFGRALPGLGDLEVERIGGAGGFVTFTGRLSQRPAREATALLQIQVPGAELADGSAGYLVDVRLCAGFDDGVLSLLSITGPVVWNANLARGAEGSGGLWEILGAPATASELRNARSIANLEALERLVLEIETGDAGGAKDRRHVIDVARAWHTLGARLRPAADPQSDL